MEVFPIQILVGRELDEREYAMLRVLTPKARKEDLENFHRIAFREKAEAYRAYVDRVFQVSVSANRKIYDQLLEDPLMCDALRDLMKDEFVKAEANGEARGVIIGAVETYHEIGVFPAEIIKRLMSRFSLSGGKVPDPITEVLNRLSES